MALTVEVATTANELNEQLIVNDEDDTETVIKSREFKANYIDTIIATLITFLLPISCRLIQQNIGALLPLIMYYSCCVFVVRLRRGTFNYSIPSHNGYYWMYTMFLPLLIIVILQQVIAYNIVIISKPNGYEWLITLFIWCPLNATLEQLLWLYLYDAFALLDVSEKYKTRLVEYGLMTLGAVMSLAFVGMIHALFWTNFLMEFDENAQPWYLIFLASKFLVIFGYMLLFKVTNSMLPVFMLHIITDCNSVIAAKYSILPFLLN